MIKIKIIAAFLVAILVSTASVGLMRPAHAEEEAKGAFPGLMKLPALIDCGPYKDIMKIINDFGEQPFAQFQGMIQIGGDKMIVGKALMYVNATTLTWSLVTEVASSGLCITATGKNFAPYIPTNVDNKSQPETDL